MREYVYYPGSFQPLALLTQASGRKERWDYHCDPNGAPVRLTSLQGEIVWSEKTGVWGERGEVYADRIANPLRFQGQYFDAETGCTIIDTVTMTLKLLDLLARTR
jgi:uncharacterized protein RhaS with RHS repeats